VNKRYTPHMTVCALLAVEALVLLLTPPARVDGNVGIRTELPERIGQYEGDEIRFCQDSQCTRRSLRLSRLKDASVCPNCGGELDEWSPAEKHWFPADTKVVRREYRSAGGQAFFVSIVVSGKERRSIHRPEVCLSSQGNSFPARHTIDVPVEGRDPVRIRLLDLSRKRTGEPAGCFAYWFVTEGRETHSHLDRLFWMAWDSLLHNTRRRWAYISVSTGRAPDGDAHVARVRRFIAELYPHIEQRSVD